jgi:hypothetical protein
VAGNTSETDSEQRGVLNCGHSEVGQYAQPEAITVLQAVEKTAKQSQENEEILGVVLLAVISR